MHRSHSKIPLFPSSSRRSRSSCSTCSRLVLLLIHWCRGNSSSCNSVVYNNCYSTSRSLLQQPLPPSSLSWSLSTLTTAFQQQQQQRREPSHRSWKRKGAKEQPPFLCHNIISSKNHIMRTPSFITTTTTTTLTRTLPAVAAVVTPDYHDDNNDLNRDGDEHENDVVTMESSSDPKSKRKLSFETKRSTEERRTKQKVDNKNNNNSNNNNNDNNNLDNDDCSSVPTLQDSPGFVMKQEEEEEEKDKKQPPQQQQLYREKLRSSGSGINNDSKEYEEFDFEQVSPNTAADNQVIPISQDYSKWKVVELKAELETRGLPKTGKKAVLVAALEESDRSSSSRVSSDDNRSTSSSFPASSPVPSSPLSSPETKTKEKDAMTDYSKLKVVELKAELESRGLPKTGTKAVLVAALEESDRSSSSSSRISSDDNNVSASSSSSSPISATSVLSSPPLSPPVAAKKEEEGSKEKEPPKTKNTKPPPDGWEEIYALVEELRKDKAAPVDHDGGEFLPETHRGPVVYRFQVLLALMLSSQTKDAVVGDAIRKFQKLGCDIDSLSTMPRETLNGCIQKVGFHNRKTEYIQQTIKVLQEKYNGDIPATADEMVRDLPGVGPKMAYIVENLAWGTQSGIGVDTHMHRLFNQLKWVNNTKTPEQTRIQLEAWLPRDKWSQVNYLWVGFGQEVQQHKPRMLRKGIHCSRPAMALKLFQKCGLDYKKEGKKLGLEQDIQNVFLKEKQEKQEKQEQQEPNE